MRDWITQPITTTFPAEKQDPRKLTENDTGREVEVIQEPKELFSKYFINTNLLGIEKLS